MQFSMRTVKYVSLYMRPSWGEHCTLPIFQLFIIEITRMQCWSKRYRIISRWKESFIKHIYTLIVNTLLTLMDIEFDCEVWEGICHLFTLVNLPSRKSAFLKNLMPNFITELSRTVTSNVISLDINKRKFSWVNIWDHPWFDSSKRFFQGRIFLIT